MRVCVLGATEVWRDDQRLDLGTRKARALVAALTLSAGRPVSVDALVDLLWGDTPPDAVANSLQAYVSGLRRVLEPDRAPRTAAKVLVTAAPGYALHVSKGDIDAASFDRLVSDAHRRLGSGDTLWEAPRLANDGLAECLAALEDALSLWRGTPYVDLGGAPGAVAERTRLEELRSVALEDRAVLRLALGDHGTVAAELESLTTAYPFRERLWGLRAVALARAGRQADALEALQELREVLDRELGLEPSAQLRDLQTAVLRQDPGLARSAPATAPPATTPTPRPEAPRLPDWPLIGRDRQLAALTAALAAAKEGTPRFAALTGEPGIGKSRLCGELAAAAAAAGARVVIGRCSQDDGAPPLWPWRQVLRGLGAEIDVPDVDDEGAEFRTWEAIVARVTESARDEPVVLVLDDLHWADPSSLRVVRLLADTVDAGRLLVLATWRTHPEPTGALADAAESLARRHAARLELSGLTAAQAAEVVQAVADVAPTDEQADQLAARTDGNPFFLVEYARLAQDRGDLGALMAEPDPPTAVSDVLARRIDRLPTDARDLLRWASVIGRSFELSVLTDAAGPDEESAIDHLDAAQAAGLVREEAVGSYAFGHALVRDELYGGLGPTRRARMHARAAEALEGRPGRESETARHWLAAGPAFAGRAWRAAAAAAEDARRVHAYGQAVELLSAALASLDADPAATDRDRYGLLIDLGEAHRWRGAWDDLLATIEQAIEVADRLGDVELMARAAASTAHGALWQSAAHGATHPRVVDALRRALAGLPDGDDPLRCRVMLGLADELYYDATVEERAALVEQALAMAHRIGDDALVLDACEIGYLAIWRTDTTAQRVELSLEAMDLATRLGNERAYVLATTLCAVAYAEMGRPDRMWELAIAARAPATRLHLPYVLVVLDTLELPWLAMAGRFQEAEERLASVIALAPTMSLQQTEEAIAGALMTLRLWQGRADEVVDALFLFEDGPIPITSTLLVFLLRAGDTERARTYARTHEVVLDGDDWFSMLNWACAGEAALGLDDPTLAAAAYARLAPYAGRSACAGSGVAMGPVDAYLAQAAAAVGDRDLAARHADDALRLMVEWQIPLAAQWLRDQRDRYGF